MEINVIFRLIVIITMVFLENNGVNCFDDEVTSVASSLTPLMRDVFGSVSTVEMDSIEETSGDAKVTYYLIELDVNFKSCCGQYDHFVNGNEELFVAKNNFGFKTVKQGMEKIWAARGSELALKVEITASYARCFTMALYLNNGFVVRCYKDSMTGKWKKQRFDSQTSLDDFNHPQEMCIVTEACAYPVIHKYNDTSKYEVKKVPAGYEYIFSEGVKVLEVKCDGHSLWRRERSDDQPLTVVYMKKHCKIALIFYEWTLLLTKVNGKWVIDQESMAKCPMPTGDYSKRFSERNFKILTKCSPTRTDPTKFYVERVCDYKLMYIFKACVECFEIRYAGVTIWQQPKHSDYYPTEFHINLRDRTVTLIGTTIQVYAYNQVGWNLQFNGMPTMVTLNIYSKKSTNEYIYSYDKKTKVATYRAKPTHCFRKIKLNRTCHSSCYVSEVAIWETKYPHDSATKVIIEGIGSSSKILTIFLIDGSKRKFIKTKKNRNWKEVEANKKIPISINVKSIMDSYAYYNKKNGEVRTYIAKEGFAFSGLHRWNGLCKSGYKNIWNSKDRTEHAKKIVVEGIGKKQKRITIHLMDGTTEKLCKV